MESRTEEYVCIHCSTKSVRLYKEYGHGLIKLTRCSKCGEPVDEYIETEFSIVFIDTILQRLEAYRHLIFNAGIQKSWKLALLFLLGEALELWLSEHYVPSRGWQDSLAKPFTVELELEWRFYLTCFLLVISNTVFVVMVTLALCVCCDRSHANSNTVRSLIIASYGKMLALPAVLWDCHPEVTRYVVTFFYLISQVQACRAASGSSTKLATMVVLVSYAVQQLAGHALSGPLLSLLDF
ncbi:protein ARV1-like [Ornithodoros turicata]|uniref:protein ARV1-like n=1 Tax=Ornithodoros turicata TaxID=34597 RepID=UPI003139B9A8